MFGSEVFGGVGLVAHLDMDVRGDCRVDLLHGQHGAQLLALLQRSRVFNRLHVEQLEAQT